MRERTARIYILKVRGRPKRNLLRSKTPAVDLSFCAFKAFESRGKNIVSALWDVTAKITSGVGHSQVEGMRTGLKLTFDDFPRLSRTVIRAIGEHVDLHIPIDRYHQEPQLLRQPR